MGESADSFHTALHCLASTGIRALHDEMVRDRLVVGLRDKSCQNSYNSILN